MSDHFEHTKARELEKIIGFKFKNLALLEEALSHPSLKQASDHKHHPDYERFEFLGDSVLNFVITDLLFHKFPTHREGELAKIKAHLVSKEVLNEIAEKINLAEYIIMTYGEEKGGGRENPSNVENTMEALVAAIYLDSNMTQVKNVIARLWHSLLHEFDFRDIDPKSSLQEWSQKHFHQMPFYEVTHKDGPVHSPIFTVQVVIGKHTGTGQGKSIKAAEKLAARNVLEQVGDE